MEEITTRLGDLRVLSHDNYRLPRILFSVNSHYDGIIRSSFAQLKKFKVREPHIKSAGKETRMLGKSRE